MAFYSILAQFKLGSRRLPGQVIQTKRIELRILLEFYSFLCYASILSAVKPMDSIVGDSNAMLTRVIMSYQLLKFI